MQLLCMYFISCHMMKPHKWIMLLPFLLVSYEVYFPGEFTLDQPWGLGDYLSQLPDTHQHLHIKPVPICISTLIHATY